MPANLPPQYHEVEKRYREAKTPIEKIQALEEMLAIIPKHKGTDHLVGDLKRRIARHKAEAQKKGPGGKGFSLYVDKEGAGQVVLVGLPNVGKSLLLSRLTHAQSEVGDYPFTTRYPRPGMVEFENVQIQLVDLPPVSPEHTDSWVFSFIRNADIVFLVIDLSRDDALEQIAVVESLLDGAKISLGREARNHLPEEPGRVVKKALLIGNKCDTEGAEETAAVLQELYGERLPLFTVSAQEGTNLAELKRLIYDVLEVVRVYTKAPGKEPSREDPVVLPRGSTLLDVGASIHKDFAEKLKFARVWGPGKYQGQRVQRDYIVQEGDIIEFHI
jgi:ribosome-interacting GTPase 1